MLLSEKIDFRAKNKEVYFITIKGSITPEDVFMHPVTDLEKTQRRNREMQRGIKNSTITVRKIKLFSQ